MNYLATLVMGSGSTNVKVIVDTGSVGLAVMGTPCSPNCAATLYDQTGSVDYTEVGAGSAWSYTYDNNLVYYYSYNSVGKTAKDKVHIDADNAIYNFYRVESMSNQASTTFTPTQTGWLGLALNMEAGYSNDFDFMEQVVGHGFLAGNK